MSLKQSPQTMSLMGRFIFSPFVLCKSIMVENIYEHKLPHYLINCIEATKTLYCFQIVLGV